MTTRLASIFAAANTRLAVAQICSKPNLWGDLPAQTAL
jgi:hypothetical protein